MFNRRKYNILILGTDGMLGYDTFNFLTRASESNSKYNLIRTVIGIDRRRIEELNLLYRHSLEAFLTSSIKFDYVINCAAYTNTNATETDNGERNLSYRLNALFPKYLAESCYRCGVKLIHISTDYVFSEFSHTPADMFLSSDIPFPKNIYGTHKLLGEQFIQNEFRNRMKDFTILRTSWLFGNHNHKSFIHKFLKNNYDVERGMFKKNIEVTDNEISIPTSTTTLDKCIYRTIFDKKCGILHAVNRNPTTRAGFANVIISKFNHLTMHTHETPGHSYVVPVERNGLHPTKSSMETDFPDEVDYWENDLEIFMTSHIQDIMTWLGVANSNNSYIDKSNHCDLKANSMTC